MRCLPKEDTLGNLVRPRPPDQGRPAVSGSRVQTVEDSAAFACRAHRLCAPPRKKGTDLSDSRQVAARLAPNLQMFSVRDSLRPLIAWGYRQLQAVPFLQSNLNLNDLYLAVLLAAHSLHVRLRPELKGGESSMRIESYGTAIDHGQADNNVLALLWGQIRSERPPEALLEQIVTTVQDRFLGFEALALASLTERMDLTTGLHDLPPIPEWPKQMRPKRNSPALGCGVAGLRGSGSARCHLFGDSARALKASVYAIGGASSGPCRLSCPNVAHARYSIASGHLGCWRCSPRTPEAAIGDCKATNSP